MPITYGLHVIYNFSDSDINMQHYENLTDEELQNYELLITYLSKGYEVNTFANSEYFSFLYDLIKLLYSPLNITALSEILVKIKTFHNAYEDVDLAFKYLMENDILHLANLKNTVFTPFYVYQNVISNLQLDTYGNFTDDNQVRRYIMSYVKLSMDIEFMHIEPDVYSLLHVDYSTLITKQEIIMELKNKNLATRDIESLGPNDKYLNLQFLNNAAPYVAFLTFLKYFS